MGTAFQPQLNDIFTAPVVLPVAQPAQVRLLAPRILDPQLVGAEAPMLVERPVRAEIQSIPEVNNAVNYDVVHINTVANAENLLAELGDQMDVALQVEPVPLLLPEIEPGAPLLHERGQEFDRNLIPNGRLERRRVRARREAAREEHGAPPAPRAPAVLLPAGLWRNPEWLRTEGCESITKIIATCCKGGSYYHAEWIQEMRNIFLKLHVNTPDLAEADEFTNVLAILLLPGLVTKLREDRHRSVVAVLRNIHSMADSAIGILDTCDLITRREGAHAAPTTRGSTISRATRLALDGRLQASLQAVEAIGCTDTGLTHETTVNITRDLHPQRDHLDTLDLNPSGHDPIRLEIDEWTSIIFSLNRTSAQGVLGWSFALVRQLMGQAEKRNDQAFMESFCGFLNRTAQGTWQESTRSLLAAGRLILLPKPGEDKRRPIAIGDAIYRIAMKGVMFKLGPTLQRALEPLQFSVRTPGGCETIAALSQLNFDAGATQILFDLPNAFNKVKRSAVLRGIRSMCPALEDTFKAYYTNPTDLWAHTTDKPFGRVGTSQTGVRQGDPLGGALFCLALQPALQQLQALISNAVNADPNKLFVRAFADDIGVSGPADCLVRLFPEMCQIFFDHLGSFPNLRKTFIFGKHITLEDVDRLRDMGNTNISNQGAVCLGVPVGDEAFRGMQTRRSIASMQSSFRSAHHPELDPQIKFSLLKFCLFPKAQYLARNVLPHIARDPLRTFDEWVLGLLDNVAGPETWSHKLGSLPLRWGGLGLSRYGGAYGIHCYRSARGLLLNNLARLDDPCWGQFSAEQLESIPTDPLSESFRHLCGTDIHEDRQQTRLTAANRLADISSLPAPSQSEPLDAFYKQNFILALGSTEEATGIADFEVVAAAKHKIAALMSGISDPYQGVGHTGLDHWVRWMGGRDHRQRLEQDVFVSALRARLLGGPIYLAQPCCLPECHGTSLKAFPLHGTCCRNMVGAKGLATSRHNLIRQALYHLILQSCHEGVDPGAAILRTERVVGRVENPDVPEGGRDVIADIRWVCPDLPADGRRELWFDVHVVEPTGVRGIRNPNGLVRRGAAASEGVSRKLTHYAQIPAVAARVVPFVLESGGFICGEVADFLDTLVKAGHKTKVKSFIREVSFIIARYRALMINNHASHNERIRLGGP